MSSLATYNSATIALLVACIIVLTCCVVFLFICLLTSLSSALCTFSDGCSLLFCSFFRCLKRPRLGNKEYISLNRGEAESEKVPTESNISRLFGAFCVAGNCGCSIGSYCCCVLTSCFLFVITTLFMILFVIFVVVTLEPLYNHDLTKFKISMDETYFFVDEGSKVTVKASCDSLDPRFLFRILDSRISYEFILAEREVDENLVHNESASSFSPNHQRRNIEEKGDYILFKKTASPGTREIEMEIDSATFDPCVHGTTSSCVIYVEAKILGQKFRSSNSEDLSILYLNDNVVILDDNEVVACGADDNLATNKPLTSGDIAVIKNEECPWNYVLIRGLRPPNETLSSSDKVYSYYVKAASIWDTLKKAVFSTGPKLIKGFKIPEDPFEFKTGISAKVAAFSFVPTANALCHKIEQISESGEKESVMSVKLELEGDLSIELDVTLSLAGKFTLAKMDIDIVPDIELARIVILTEIGPIVLVPFFFVSAGMEMSVEQKISTTFRASLNVQAKLGAYWESTRPFDITPIREFDVTPTFRPQDGASLSCKGSLSFSLVPTFGVVLGLSPKWKIFPRFNFPLTLSASAEIGDGNSKALPSAQQQEQRALHLQLPFPEDSRRTSPHDEAFQFLYGNINSNCLCLSSDHCSINFHSSGSISGAVQFRWFDFHPQITLFTKEFTVLDICIGVPPEVAKLCGTMCLDGQSCPKSSQCCGAQLFGSQLCCDPNIPNLGACCYNRGTGVCCGETTPVCCPIKGDLAVKCCSKGSFCCPAGIGPYYCADPGDTCCPSLDYTSHNEVCGPDQQCCSYKDISRCCPSEGVCCKNYMDVPLCCESGQTCTNLGCHDGE